MKRLQHVLGWAIVVLGVMGFVLFFRIIIDKAYFNTSWEIDTKLAADFGSFVGGFVGTIFSLIGTLVVAYTFEKQFRQTNRMFEEQNKLNRKSEATNNFFKMIDFQNAIIEQMELPTIKDGNEKGRKVFVTSKEQINEILDLYSRHKGGAKDKTGLISIYDLNDNELFDFTYTLFYYGFPDVFSDSFARDHSPNIISTLRKAGYSKRRIKRYLKAMEFQLCDYGNKTDNKPIREWLINRVNQPYLSSYFQNLYGAINLVDSNTDFEDSEKENLINILRAQLSTPELYILDIHRRSKISKVTGEDWSTYINNYGLLKNLPGIERLNKKGIANRVISQKKTCYTFWF